MYVSLGRHCTYVSKLKKNHCTLYEEVIFICTSFVKRAMIELKSKLYLTYYTCKIKVCRKERRKVESELHDEETSLQFLAVFIEKLVRYGKSKLRVLRSLGVRAFMTPCRKISISRASERRIFSMYHRARSTRKRSWNPVYIGG